MEKASETDPEARGKKKKPSLCYDYEPVRELNVSCEYGAVDMLARLWRHADIYNISLSLKQQKIYTESDRHTERVSQKGNK